MKIQQKSSNRLFFNQYRFSVTLYTDGIGLLRFRCHETIDRIVDQNKKGIKKEKKLNTIFDSFAITDSMPLHEILDVIAEYSDTRLVHSEWYKAKLYFNNLSLISQLENINKLQLANLSKRIVDRPDNSIVLKKSDFKFRSYLSRSKSFDYASEENIQSFLKTQPFDYFKPSPLLKKWINNIKLPDHTQQPQIMIFGKVFYPRPSIIENQMFLDHNNKSIISMMNLIRPGTIRKTVDIIVDK